LFTAVYSRISEEIGKKTQREICIPLVEEENSKDTIDPQFERRIDLSQISGNAKSPKKT